MNRMSEYAEWARAGVGGARGTMRDKENVNTNR